jgi:Tol biopolymer transport system component
MKLLKLTPIIAAAAVILAGYGSAAVHSSPAVSLASRSIPDAAYPAAFVASTSNSQGTSSGLAVFSSSDGRLVRWLVRSKSQPTPVAISPDGAWVYYYFPVAKPPCPTEGFVEPVLWRVRVSGGRPQRTDIRTTNLAFSPDGKMVAYTSERSCGRTLLIVVRDQRTGATRQIIAAHNDLSGNGVISDAQLSWAPDDVHLAVATIAAAAINTLVVVDARRATDITLTQPIAPCTSTPPSVQVGCLTPSFDVHGRLTFLYWREAQGQLGLWVVRWQNHHATRLFKVSHGAATFADMAADRTGSAILLETSDGMWRWSSGALTLIRRSSPRSILSNPLWL